MKQKQVAELTVGFCECLQSVSPGAVLTEIAEASGIPKEIMEHYKNVPYLNPKDIVDAVIYVLGTPPHVQVGTLCLNCAVQRTLYAHPRLYSLHGYDTCCISYFHCKNQSFNDA
jgi:hypothetical protein